MFKYTELGTGARQALCRVMLEASMMLISFRYDLVVSVDQRHVTRKVEHPFLRLLVPKQLK